MHVIGYKRNLSPEAPKALAEGALHAVNAPKALAEGVHHKMVAVPHKKSHNGSGSAEGKPKILKGAFGARFQRRGARTAQVALPCESSRCSVELSLPRVLR